MFVLITRPIYQVSVYRTTGPLVFVSQTGTGLSHQNGNHYENTSMQYTAIFHGIKNEIF